MLTIAQGCDFKAKQAIRMEYRRYLTQCHKAEDAELICKAMKRFGIDCRVIKSTDSDRSAPFEVMAHDSESFETVANFHTLLSRSSHSGYGEGLKEGSAMARRIYKS